MEELENFKSLTELDLSNNPKMAGDLKNLFDGLAVLKSVQARGFIPGCFCTGFPPPSFSARSPKP